MMNKQTDIEGLIRKTRQYEFVDGLRDLQLAAIMAFFVVFAWLVFTQTGVRWYLRLILFFKDTFGNWAPWIDGLLILLIIISVLGGSLWLMRTMRRKWLWRESGWVKPLPWQVPRKVSILSVVIVLTGIGLAIALFVADMVEASFILRMLWVATGWALGFTLIGVGREIGLKRYIWLGSVGGIASTVLLFVPLTFGQVAIVLYGAWALVLGISGAITLRRALAATNQVNHGG
jgi:hypothetical protein